MYKRSFKDYFGNRKVLYLLLVIVLVSISTLTLVYAALNVTLNIVGTADISAASWDVHLANVNVNTQSVSGNDPTISGGTTATFSTKLEVPGDFYEFTVDVVNDGTIDAMIESVVKTPTLTTAQAKYLKYEIEYQNGESINTRQLVKKNSFVRLKVRLEFRKDVTADILPTTAETLNLSFTVVYAQSDGTGNNVIDGGVTKAKVISGDYDTVGSEICIQEECFYVISSDETSVTMLAKYNLYVGGESNDSTKVYKAYGIEATGIQDSTMLGWVSGQNIRKGVTASCYDSSGVSKVIEYINNYQTIIEEKYGVEVEEARFITLSEFTELGCSWNERTCASSPYPWIYSTSYWLGVNTSGTGAFIVSNGQMDQNACAINNSFGVRPVITISKSKF